METYGDRLSRLSARLYIDHVIRLARQKRTANLRFHESPGRCFKSKTGRVLMASAFSDVGAELAKIEIDEYGHFLRIHSNEWMCFPKNRNAHVPILYVIISGGKYVAGYKYLDETENKDHEGAPQDSVSGLLEEIAIIKSAISEVITMEKNRVMDKKIDEEQAGTEDEGGEDDDGGFGGDDSGDGMGGGDLGDLG